MIRITGTRAAAIAIASAAMLAAGTAMAAEGTFVSASVDATTNTDMRTDGSVATATAGGASSFGTAIGDLTHIHVLGLDTLHYSAGAPGSSGFSDFIFEVQGASGPVALTFNFVTTGSFDADESINFARSGSFGINLFSSTGPSPFVNGGFVDVQCIGCGGRLYNGQITTGPDYFGPGATSSPWLGANPGGYALSSTFLGGTPGAGRLQLQALGTAGSASYDFDLALASITTSGSAQGLSVYIPATGQTLAITSTSAAPEPMAWALMILGFGTAGAQVRRRRAAA